MRRAGAAVGEAQMWKHGLTCFRGCWLYQQTAVREHSSRGGEKGDVLTELKNGGATLRCLLSWREVSAHTSPMCTLQPGAPGGSVGRLVSVHRHARLPLGHCLSQQRQHCAANWRHGSLLLSVPFTVCPVDYSQVNLFKNQYHDSILLFKIPTWLPAS